MDATATTTEIARLASSSRIFLLAALALFAAAALYGFSVFRRRLRRKEQEIEFLRDREAQRVQLCDSSGHLLDATCLCTRCLAWQHSYELSAESTVATGTELVNPNADPGALYLDSNFQPDWDYGLTHTRYETESTYRCTRCSQEKKSTVVHYS